MKARQLCQAYTVAQRLCDSEPYQVNVGDDLSRRSYYSYTRV